MRLLAISLALVFLPSFAAEAGRDAHAPGFRQPMPAGRVVDELRSAVAADDGDAIRTLAAATWPDPFEVAARMLFPPTPGAEAEETDRVALRRFAEAAAPETGVRAFIEHWLDAAPDAFARERELWRVSARMTMRIRAGEHASALESWSAAKPVLAATPHSHQGPTVRRLHARALRHMGRTTEAVAVLEDLVQRLHARVWPSFEAFAQHRLAAAYRVAGESEDTVLAATQRAEVLLTRTRRWPDLISALALQSGCERRLGRLPEAESILHRALAVAARTGRAGDRLKITLNLAEVAGERGHAGTAAMLRSRVFEEGRTLDAPDWAAWAARDLALAAMSAGQTADALRLGDWLEDHVDGVAHGILRGNAFMVLGDLAAWRGRTAVARAHYERALADHRGGGGPALVFSDLCRILRLPIVEGERTRGADKSMLAALRVVAEEAAVASDTASVLADWSRCELDAGHLDEAARIATRAVAVESGHAGPGREHLASLQLARVDVARGAFDAAIVRLRPIARRLSAEDGSRLVALDLLGRCEAGKGHWQASVQHFRDAVAAQEVRRNGVAARESFAQRRREHTLATRGVRAAAAWSGAEGGSAALNAAWWFREMACGRLLAAGIAQDPSPRSEEETDGRGLLDALARVEEAHARVVLAVVDGDAAQQRSVRVRLQEAHEALFRVESRASRRGATGARLAPPRPLAEVRASLDPGHAILAFTFGPLDVTGFAVTSDEARVLRLGDAGEIRTLLVRWRRLASTPGGPDTKLAARLYDTLLRPFDDQIDARPHWTVLADGPLCGAPVDAWIRKTPDGDERVIARHTVSYGQGIGVLDVLRARHAARSPARGVVAVGDPTYAAPTDAETEDWQIVAARGRGGLRMRSLPSSGAEARDAAALYPDAERTVLRRADASRDALLAALGGRERPLDCLHLACHGLVDDRLPSLSGLVLAGGEMLTAERVGITSVRAGLVVLSACHSGGEAVAAGEGLLGLTRAFCRAGATRVLCTTWQVADESTATLMGAFHRARRRAGLSDAAALRHARLSLMQETATAHPYYWAGFQLWGPGRD